MTGSKPIPPEQFGDPRGPQSMGGASGGHSGPLSPQRAGGNLAVAGVGSEPATADAPRGQLEILLVDDSEDDLVLLAEAFRDLPEARLLPPARDGQSALSRLRGGEGLGGEPLARRPDLLLLDVNLPGLNGFEVVAAIRAVPGLQTLPVVLLSTSSLDTDVQRAYRSGANSYITKPASFDRLREIAQALVVYWCQTVRIPQG